MSNFSLISISFFKDRSNQVYLFIFVIIFLFCFIGTESVKINFFSNFRITFLVVSADQWANHCLDSFFRLISIS